MDAIDDALDKYRGYGVRLQFYFQSLGQLKKCFPNGQDQNLLSNCSQIYFAVNDRDTAQYVSDRLGEGTIVVESGGVSRGTTRQRSPMGENSVSQSFTGNDNWGLQARRLLKPEEVTALPARLAITFTPGAPPILTSLVRYYEEKLKPGGRNGLWDKWEKAVIFLRCFGFLAMAATTFACAAAFVREQRAMWARPAAKVRYEFRKNDVR
jgi:type IV secretion system protein VirD4